MPDLNLDLSEAQSFDPVPDDTYLCEVVEVSDVQSGQKANYVTVTLEIAEGEHQGRRLFNNLMVTGKASGMFVDFLNKALDTDYDVDEMDELTINTDDLIGARVGVITKQEEYPEGSGEMRSQVKRIVRAE